METNKTQGVIANKQPRQHWLRQISLKVLYFTKRRSSASSVLKQPLTGEAGALAALDRLYAQNDAGMQRLADH